MFQEFHQGGAEPVQEEKKKEPSDIMSTIFKTVNSVRDVVTPTPKPEEGEGKEPETEQEETETQQEEPVTETQQEETETQQEETETQQEEEPETQQEETETQQEEEPEIEQKEEPEPEAKEEDLQMGGADPTQEKKFSKGKYILLWKRWTRKSQKKIYKEFINKEILPNPDDEQGFDYKKKVDNDALKNIFTLNEGKTEFYPTLKKIYENLIISTYSLDSTLKTEINEEDIKNFTDQLNYYNKVIKAIESNTLSKKKEFDKLKKETTDRAEQIGLEVFLTMPKDDNKKINDTIKKIINGDKNTYDKIKNINIPLNIFKSSYSTAALLYQILMIIIKKDDFNLFHRIDDKDTDLDGPLVFKHLCAIMESKNLLNNELKGFCSKSREALVNATYNQPLYGEIEQSYQNIQNLSKVTEAEEAARKKAAARKAAEEAAAKKAAEEEAARKAKEEAAAKKKAEEEAKKAYKVSFGGKVTEAYNNFKTKSNKTLDEENLLKLLKNLNDKAVNLGDVPDVDYEKIKEQLATYHVTDPKERINDVIIIMDEKETDVEIETLYSSLKKKDQTRTTGGSKKTKKNKRGGSSKKRRTLKKFD